MALRFFGSAPEILDQDYKTEHTSHHVWKYHGDQPTEPEDLVENKKKKNKCLQKISPQGTIVPGELTKNCIKLNPSINA